jgi:hypothetical protein
MSPVVEQLKSSIYGLLLGNEQVSLPPHTYSYYLYR